ncbi:hypothetical protein FOA43_001302 [Brettanomyces nanus]|uniref:Zn(2)-C6 fungal-type domain-containing protein n=1 Tax=Eeniella nana TaxID=13502 RepID=A0A875S0X5_EENNA|nr:uncharacterized protein FOA43_001302 [Brettanomyces nanus]QPG73985.1 hypothetical protein FOA43_001302 [Brettanomyces nanus]
MPGLLTSYYPMVLTTSEASSEVSPKVPSADTSETPYIKERKRSIIDITAESDTQLPSKPIADVVKPCSPVCLSSDDNESDSSSSEADDKCGTGENSDLHHNYSLANAAAKLAGAVHKKRAFSRRSRTGCLTCRRRRIKCDEGRPFCHNCIKSRKVCSGYAHVEAMLQSNKKKLKSRDSIDRDGSELNLSGVPRAYEVPPMSYNASELAAQYHAPSYVAVPPPPANWQYVLTSRRSPLPSLPSLPTMPPLALTATPTSSSATSVAPPLSVPAYSSRQLPRFSVISSSDFAPLRRMSQPSMEDTLQQQQQQPPLRRSSSSEIQLKLQPKQARNASYDHLSWQYSPTSPVARQQPFFVQPGILQLQHPPQPQPQPQFQQLPMQVQQQPTPTYSSYPSWTWQCQPVPIAPLQLEQTARQGLLSPDGRQMQQSVDPYMYRVAPIRR